MIGPSSCTTSRRWRVSALTARQAAAASVRAAASSPPGRQTSRLLTVVTPADRRVVEAARTTRLADAVAGASGRRPAADSAVLLGGFGGTWARWADVAGLPVDEPTLRRAGVSLGAGVVAPLWTDACGLVQTASIVGYLARASAWQCGPCLFGLPALADCVGRLAAGQARRGELRRLRRDLEELAGRGACHHPDGALRLVASALDVFAEDVARHLAGAPCCRPGGTIPVPRSGDDVA